LYPIRQAMHTTWLKQIPLIKQCSTLNVIVSILSFILPHRATREQEVIRQLEIRHERRRSAIESAYRTQLKTR